MITVNEAQKIVLEHCKTIGHQIETVSFKQALHRVLAVDIKAKDPLPLDRAKINQGATVRKAKKARKKADKSAAAAKESGMSSLFLMLARLMPPRRQTH